MAEEKSLRWMLTTGAKAMYFKEPDVKGPTHPARRLEEGLDMLCDHIEKLEERIAELEKGK